MVPQNPDNVIIVRNRQKEFWLVIVDEDQRLFSVEGPMLTDEAWTKAVVEAQERAAG